MRVLTSLAAVVLIVTPVWAQAPDRWDRDLFDPANESTPADLVLPMPCGAAMAFQKVTVPLDVSDPIADRPVRLGQSLDQTGYSDYLRPAFLRGSFSDTETGASHYYIARYELTLGQYRALQGDCAAPTRKDRLAKGDLSWFDAVAVAQAYSAWLYETRPELLPREDEALAFVRLPTEAEWEYATRGGANIDATLFPALTFFNEGEMRDYARHQAAGSARGKLGPVGLLKPNPLGLYDVYGNAEELMLEPFRLNVIGRRGGQVGGIVTRGGSALSTGDQIYSAQRTEYAPFDQASNGPLRSATFGMRLVLATHITTSDQRLTRIRDRWVDLAGVGEDESAVDVDPVNRLTRLIEAEIDPRRKNALNDLKLDFRRSRDRAQSALQQTAHATLLAGAVFVETLDENASDIDNKAGNIRLLVELQRAGNKTPLTTRQLEKHVEQISQMRRVRSTYLLSFRAALETLASDIPRDVSRAAYDVLREELALSERDDTRQRLDRFWADLSVYRQRPDISQEELLSLSLD